MKILFLTENFPPETNAAANRVFERAVYWVRWGYDVTVITGAPNFPQGNVYDGYRNKWYQTEMRDGIKVIRVKTFIAPNRGNWLRAIDFASFLVTAFVAGMFVRPPDVVVATSPQFFSAVAGWLVGLFHRRPFVFELGDIWPASIIAVGAMKENLGLRMMEKFERFLYRRASCIAAVSPAFKQNLVKRGIPADKIAIVINGVEQFRFHPSSVDPVLARDWNLTGKFVVGYLGTHGMAHALGNVLDAAELLRDEPNICFLFVGDGAEREKLIASAQERQLDNVIFIPPQPRSEMLRVWSLCDVALVHLKDSPAFAEVIPSKIFEAMAMGCPILLASPKGAASSIVTGDNAGIWVPAEQPDQLAQRVLRLVRDVDELQVLAANALGAAPKYSRRQQSEEMLQVLEIAAIGRGDRVAPFLSGQAATLAG
jgi:colanic acid biosynthesis glycosyl transferase WcaI